MKRERVVVAMSGGVDSSVAAALLKSQGFEVIGITMCFNFPQANRKKPACCSPQAIEDARRVAHKLGIRHYVLNMQKVLQETVIKDFCEQYLKGRTPNPCVRCNQFVKFDSLLKKVQSLDAKFLATGHYVRIGKTRRQKRQTQRYILKKGKDKFKDQSYFLYRLNQKQLKHIFFPLGNYTKAHVRKLAKKFNLPVAEKKASQEICFLPEDSYHNFLKNYTRLDIKPGPVVDMQDNILGKHKGIPFYTIGQREGLGIARGYPLHIIKIEPKKNKITVGKREDVYKKEFFIKKTHFILRAIKKKIALKVRIRYNHKEAVAKVFPFGRKIKVRFREKQFAITPGQSAVFYEKDKVLGGGIIDEVLS